MKNSWRMFFMGLGGFIVGVLALFAVTKSKPAWFVKPAPAPVLVQNQNFDDVFGDDFSNMMEDPFQAMRKFRGDLTDPFDHWFERKFGGTVNDITEHEDNNYVYFNVKVEDLKSTSIQTKVENGYIEISGTTEKKSGHGDGESIYESAFHRSFPVPANVDANRMQTLTENGEIVLKFPKLKS